MSLPWTWPPPISTLNSSDVTNVSTVPGATVTDALDSLSAIGDLRPYAWMAQAPSSPDAWDFDATLATDPDLANGGWTVKLNGAPYTVLTRSGDIQAPALATAPPAGTYWSTLINGRLVMRFPSAAGVEIFKASAGSYTYKFHASPANWDGTQSLFGFVANGTNFDQAGNNICYAGRSNATTVTAVTFIGPATFNVAFTAVDNATELNVDRLIYLFDAGVGARAVGVSFRYPNGVFWRASLTGMNAVFTTSSAGILFAAGNAGGPNWLYVDSLRRLPPAEFI